ncbi:MAG: hypothetical protein J6P74_01015 [Paludibacteraceae bacterium]|nr:hypothetical protein [Paludibacteraceae bacterium]
MNYYAVFASQNGYTTATILDEKWNVVDWDGTNKIVGGSYSSWATNFANAPSTSFKISSTEYKAIVFDVNSARTITSESAYSNLKEVRITGSNRSSFAMDVTVKVSADKSSWTTVATKSLGTASNTTPQTLEYTLDTKGNYYVRIETEAKSSGNKTGITNIRLYQEQDYYLTDYSTTCDRVSSPVALIWAGDASSTLVDGTKSESIAVGSDLTLPTLTKADYRFDGWKATINSVAKAEVFTGGDKFTVNHPVTFTAQWTQVFSVSDPTDGLTSYKDVQVTSTTQTFSTVGMHNAVPSVTVADGTHFTMTINSHEANGSNEDYSYTFTYQPNAFGTGSGAATNTTTATVTDARTGVVSSAITLSGRSLPEEFVIALKDGDYWYALPNNLQTSSGSSHSTPIKITVDNTTMPTAAVYASTNTVYKGQARSNSANNINGIRFTTTGDDHLQGSSGVGTNPMWLASSNSDGNQSFYLKSTDFGAYVVKLGPSAEKQMGIYTVGGKNYIGYTSTIGAANIYFLPITNKYTTREASVYEWGEHGVIVEADMTNVASATMHIDGASPTAATVTGVNGDLGGTKYVKVDGGALTVGAVANDGKQLYIHWKNSGGVEIAASQITIPCVIAANVTMSDLSTDVAVWAKKEVHILPGAKLTANAATIDATNVTIPTMYVYPGATLDVTTGKLTASTLRLRSGWTRAGTKKYDVARVHIASGKALSKSTFTLDYDIYDSGEGKHYYPIAVPFPIAVSGVDYLDETLAAASTYGTHYVIKRYDGASRAENGAMGDNWVKVDDDETLAPSEGYIMTGVGIPAYGGCIIRFPLDANDNWTNNGEKASYSTTTRNVISVTHHEGAATAGGGANVRHEGWNMLANPYLSCFATDGNTTHSETDGFIKGHFTITGDPSDPYGWSDKDDNIYVSVPTHDFSEYIQSNINDTELLPGWSFFIQAAKDGNVTFAVAGQQADSDLPIYAPKREANESPVVKTGIILSDGNKSDKTTLLISDKYSADEYEINADLEKMFGNGYTLATYSLARDARLAYNAMSMSDAKNVIPIGFRAPEDGEYTFSLNPRYAEAAVERVDLIDYLTGEVTNLMMSNYTFTTGRTQDDERFALNVVPMANMPTGVEDSDVRNQNSYPEGTIISDVRKIILDDKMFIIRDGLMYDATGKRVKEINK